MTVLVDTGVLYANHDKSASINREASDAIDAVYDGEFGQPFISDYIFDETVTFTRARTDSHESTKELSHLLRAQGQYPRIYDIIHVSPAVFGDAVAAFEEYSDQELSFTDATSIALTNRRDIDEILSFDADFDDLIPRIDPGEV